MSLTTVPDINPAEIFADVNTLAEMEHAVAACGAQHNRKLDFCQLMAEQSGTTRRLIKEFGPTGPALYQRFLNSHPALALRMEDSNLASSPDAASAAVRAFRASLNQ